ncbi:MAG: Vacuolar protein sorting-associated protein 41 [Pleopsidium flavum]|nr:MAG: Vacuolar protein sorting-associated protein 41 [Pleopsidium flavum]
MAAEADGKEQDGDGKNRGVANGADGGSNADEEEEEEEEDEPKLKYATLTKSLGPVYRNGDATSAFLVAGDKMIVGTHYGNIHVLSLPSLKSLRVYRAHSASITAISISPFSAPLPTGKPSAVDKVTSQHRSSPRQSISATSTTSASPRSVKPPLVPATPSNAIHIATSSIDGNVCIASLVDSKDVLLRNFGRPVQAVGLSPDYRNDRSYLSGGLAGNLVLTVGGRSGTSSTSTTTGSTAASASGWLGAIGLGSNTGKDTILHSGEGTISTIKWSLSGKFVVWINEHGIKIMRSNLRLESTEHDFAWKRISHVDRPNRPGWDEMAGVWKGRVEWIDENGLEVEADASFTSNGSSGDPHKTAKRAESQNTVNLPKARLIEKLVVGWGGTVWIINVHPGGPGTGKDVGERKVGHSEVVTILRTDCIISGLSLYTPSLLLVLAYITPDDDDSEQASSMSTSRKRGIQHRKKALQPELRVIDITTKEEISADSLNVGRFESLSATDYHLGILPPPRTSTVNAPSRGTLEAISGGLWDATTYPTRIFSSAASIRSQGSSNDLETSTKAASGGSSEQVSYPNKQARAAHSATAGQSLKIYIHSPYDCVLAVKRDLTDHLSWLDSHGMYKEAWELIDDFPEAVTATSDRLSDSSPSTPTKAQASLLDFFADDNSQPTQPVGQAFNSAVEKEKRRVGERWVQQLVNSEEWKTAGEVCGKVLGTSASWQHWVWAFAHANKFEEITPYIPTTQLQPPLPSVIYEVILGHYVSNDRLKLRELLNTWPSDLFDIKSVTAAIEGKLKSGEVREDSFEDDEQGRDWRILMNGLAKLLLDDGRPREALKYYIRLQDADAAMEIIRDHHLLGSLSDDIPGFILLRVSKEQRETAPLRELEEATSEPIELLVNEAQHGIVRPETVIVQLQESDGLLPYLFFYLRALWKGTGANDQIGSVDRTVTESKSLVEEFSDIAIEIFAEYDRPLLMDFLKTSQSYTLEKALAISESRNYIPELVYLLSKTGDTKRALFLILDKLRDVSQAISFAKSQDDPELWNELLEYSMDKPRYIRRLLEEVGTAINPITLVRRIPKGLEIQGLRDGLIRMIKEYEIQDSISEGVARVFRGEVAMGMDTLRTGQKKGVRFDVSRDHSRRTAAEQTGDGAEHKDKPAATPKPGHCVGCDKPFTENETETLVGFVCGHVFHLSCLVLYDYTEQQTNSDLQAEGPTDEEDGYTTRSVGAKVLHARLIRDKITDGCPCFVHKKEAS